MLLGLAIYNSIILDVHFPRVLYSKLLAIRHTLQDLAFVDPGLAQGFQKLLDYKGDDVEEVFDSNFQISYEEFGERHTYDLKEGGGNIPLTNSNRQ